MVQRSPYRHVFARPVADHLDTIERRHHTLIRATIAEQLSYEPNRETRNRKQLSQPTSFGATWELRFGPGNRFRVFYHIDEACHEIRILAIGIKRRERVFIGGEEFKE